MNVLNFVQNYVKLLVLSSVSIAGVKLKTAFKRFLAKHKNVCAIDRSLF
jgi:predicted lysophospholipase L1 biosynthesis ABC-type transport system permease subunit